MREQLVDAAVRLRRQLREHVLEVHHHATLCIAAYAFLLTRRLTAPKKLCRIPFSARSLPYPQASGPGAPLRRQRHLPDSITTLRLELAAPP